MTDVVRQTSIAAIATMTTFCKFCGWMSRSIFKAYLLVRAVASQVHGFASSTSLIRSGHHYGLGVFAQCTLADLVGLRIVGYSARLLWLRRRLPPMPERQ